MTAPATPTRGSVTWDGHDGFAGQPLDPDGDGADDGFMRPLRAFDVGVPAALAHEEHAGVIRAFLDARQNQTVPETAAADNLKSLAMVYAAVEGSDTQTRVGISPGQGGSRAAGPTVPRLRTHSEPMPMATRSRSTVGPQSLDPPYAEPTRARSSRSSRANPPDRIGHRHQVRGSRLRSSTWKAGA